MADPLNHGGGPGEWHEKPKLRVVDDRDARIADLEAALKPFAVASDSYDGEAPAHVVASKGGAIVSVYDLRIAKAVLG